jgi:hypothetical protein
MTENVALLLVDDRPENLVALEAILGNEGLDLVKAGSGNDALRHSLKRDFALVLLDVQMPGMDGFETAELMRSNPKTRHLPIIFVTAGVKDIQLQFKGYDLGAVDYLIKPVDPHILQSKVTVFCELYRQRRQIEANQLLLEAKIKERVAMLRESEERFHMLATHVPVGIYQIDTQGNCLFVNRRWCEIAGLSAEEAAGPGWTRTIHPDDRDAVASIWCGKLPAGGEWSMDYRFLGPDGRIIWVNGSAIAIRGQAGRSPDILATTSRSPRASAARNGSACAARSWCGSPRMPLCRRSSISSPRARNSRCMASAAPSCCWMIRASKCLSARSRAGRTGSAARAA